MSSKQAISLEVRKAFDAWGEAWNNGDIDGYLEGYFDSPETRVTYNTKVIRGKQVLVDMNKSHFASPEAMGKLSTTHFEVEPIGEMDAVVFGKMKREGGASPVDAVFTAHVRKIEGEWRIISEHGSV